MMRFLVAFFPLLWLLSACSGDSAGGGTQLEPKPPGLEAEPRWLTYTCVEPGCDTMLTVHIEVLGPRDVAVKRIVLSESERNDFQVVPELEPPFIIESGNRFRIDVRYAPDGDPRLGDLNLRITFTDASASESGERIPPGELVVPLVRRLVGEPLLKANPVHLNFGAVLPQADKTLPLALENAGFGNVGLVIDNVEVEPDTVLSVENMPATALVPGQSWDLNIVYAPTEEAYLDGTITVIPAQGPESAATVTVQGTSISDPSLLPQPEAVDFGEVPVGTETARTLALVNRGAEDLIIHGVDLTDSVVGGTLTAGLTRGATTATVTALQQIEVELDLAAQAPGEINTYVRISSNDPEQPIVDVPVIGLMTKPVVEVSPATLDFGPVPRGWTLVRSIEISNVGHGELSLTNVGMILGSSQLFTMRTVPSLPISLRHNQRVGIEIEFRSEAEAVFNGTLAIDSNDPETPFLEIPVAATGASCDEGCPIANGTPTCSSGLCAIDSCDPDWYDADLDPSTGCECREVGNDPGEFCAEGIYLGTLDDEGDRATYTGILPTEDDIDTIRFFGEDKFQFGSDDFDVRVTLESSDPGIRFCAYRHDTDQHLNECFWENERCPTNLSFRRDGSSGPTDSADFSIKVYREPGSAPSCATYTLFMRNG